MENWHPEADVELNTLVMSYCRLILCRQFLVTGSKLI